jgi:hypothetical protein
MRKATWILALALLSVTAFFGLYNGPRELSGGTTNLQRSVSIGVILYGVFGLVGVVGLARKRPWVVTVCAIWALVVVYVASVASFAYHDPSLSQGGTIVGVFAAGIVTALIGAFVVWAASVATRDRRVSDTGVSGDIPRP